MKDKRFSNQFVNLTTNNTDIMLLIIKLIINLKRFLLFQYFNKNIIYEV